MRCEEDMTVHEFGRYCQAEKEKLQTPEFVLRKIKAIFPNETSEEVLAIMREEKLAYLRIQLALLKWCDIPHCYKPSLNHLRNLVKTAKEDFRDILVVEELHYAHLSFNAPVEAQIAAMQRDLDDYLYWIQS